MSQPRITNREYHMVMLDAISTYSLCTSAGVDEVITLGNSDRLTVTLAKARSYLASPSADAFEDLVNHLNVHFDHLLATKENVSLLLDNPSQLSLTGSKLKDGQLKDLVIGLIPIAILRELIKKHKAYTKSAAKSQAFVEFAIHYSDAFSGSGGT